VLKANTRMNELVLSRLSESDLPTPHKEGIRRSYAALGTALTVDKNALDPGLDAAVTALYPTFVDANPGDEVAMTLSIAKLLLDGYAGSGAMSLPGFDYHTNTRAPGELADFRAGRLIGFALELAARKNKDLFLYVSTDGAQNSARAVIDDSPDGRGKL